MITINTNKQGISLVFAKKGDELWVNRLIDNSALEFAEVKRVSKVLIKVKFSTNTLVTVTGLHAKGTACTTLNFAREDRGRDAGKIYFGSKNRRFWPKLRAAAHKLDNILETVSATGGLEFVPTFEDEWLLPDFGQEFAGNIGWIVERKYLNKILSVLEPEKTEEVTATVEDTDVLSTLEALSQKYGIVAVNTEAEVAGSAE